MRAREPDLRGYAINGGVRLYYEVFGGGGDTVVLVPPLQIVHGRMWKMQVPFLARRYRTVVYDPRGNGRSDRPSTGYGMDALVKDALAVMDDLAVERCGLVTVSNGTFTCLDLAARHPERVSGIVIIGGAVVGGRPHDWAQRKAARLAGPEGYDAYVRQFWNDTFTEPHSTKPKDDGWEWAHETDARTLIAASEEGWFHADTRPLAGRVGCPVLIIHGTDDRKESYEDGLDLHARLLHSRLITFERSGHLPNLRDPVRVNLLARTFLDRLARRGEP